MPTVDGLNLIGEGLRFYPDAMVSLRKFVHDLHVVLGVFMKNLPDLSRAFGVELPAKQIRLEAVPDNVTKPTGKGEDAWICVFVEKKVFGCLSAGVYWFTEDGAQHVNAFAGMAARNKRIFDGSWALLRGAQPSHRLDHEDYDIWLADTVSPEVPEALASTVDKLLREWIRLWKDIGGMKAVVKP